MHPNKKESFMLFVSIYLGVLYKNSLFRILHTEKIVLMLATLHTAWIRRLWA